MITPLLHLVAGPTASGKTALAHALARRHGIPIISADSMQVYRGLPIATAAPTAQQLGEVTYHLVGCLDPASTFTAARFLDEVRAIARTLPPGPGALVVGGTGLYLLVLRNGLFDEPPRPEGLREALRRRLAEVGPEALHRELQLADPQAAATLHPNDAIRVMRALEVHSTAGRPLTDLWREARQQPPDSLPPLGRTVVLMPPRDSLYTRIGQRARDMVRQGLLRELQALLQSHDPGANSPALRPLGCRDLALALATGQLTPDTPPDDPRLLPHLEAMTQATRRYSKRQTTWLKKYAAPNPPDCTWIDPTTFPNAQAAVEALDRILFGGGGGGQSPAA